ncbi:MAG: BrnT family toxin [Acaryochloris sp. RU_4_1]|nr:BrnT family toxin [Acaryochloris sp. RU_4_1]
MDLEFEWDENKAESNFIKHGIRFEEAKVVFRSDSGSITFSDPEHSFDEARYIEIGFSARGQLLVVSYVERSGKIRVISVRKATPSEERLYDQG